MRAALEAAEPMVVYFWWLGKGLGLLGDWVIGRFIAYVAKETLIWEGEAADFRSGK